MVYLQKACSVSSISIEHLDQSGGADSKALFILLVILELYSHPPIYRSCQISGTLLELFPAFRSASWLFYGNDSAQKKGLLPEHVMTPRGCSRLHRQPLSNIFGTEVLSIRDAHPTTLANSC